MNIANAALVEEAAAAAGSMRDQAEQLSRVVSVFKMSGMDLPAAAASGGPPRRWRLR